jgi:hypothetical protein
MVAKENLVFLAYCSNECYVTLTDKVPKGVTVDFERETWTFKRRSYTIGGIGRHCDYGCRYGPIGAYDRTKLEHLQNMISDSGDATQEARRFSEED